MSVTPREPRAKQAQPTLAPHSDRVQKYLMFIIIAACASSPELLLSTTTGKMYCPLAESRSDASTDGEPDKDEQIREKLLALDKSSLVPYEFIRTPAQPHGVLYHAYYNSQLSLRQVLLNFNDPLSPGIVLLWMFQIFSTLEYLHQRQLNHGHLSLDTVLVVPSSTGTGTTSPTSGNSSGCIQLIEYARHHDQVLEPERIYDDYHALKRIWKKLHQHMSNTKTAKEIELKGHYQAELDQFDTTLRRICRTMAKHVENPKPNLLEKFELVRKNLVSQCWPAFEQTHASWIETQHKRDLHHQRQEVMDEIRLWHQTFESQMQRKPTETEKNHAISGMLVRMKMIKSQLATF